MKYWIFDLEPYEERYTAQMRRWVENAFEKRNREYEFVTPRNDISHTTLDEFPLDVLSSDVNNGTVLDAVGTNYYKAKQIALFMEKINDGEVKKGDCVFVFDFQYPGLEAVRYTSDLLGLDLKIYAVCHASSYVQGDFTEDMAPWLFWFENGWWTMCDGIFVGSDYHAHSILTRRNKELGEKIHVTGNVFDSKDVKEGIDIKPYADRKYDIIFPSRWDKEKNPADFVTILELLQKPNSYFTGSSKPVLNVLITTSRDSFDKGSDKISRQRLEMVKAMNLDAHMLNNLEIEIQEGLTKKEYYQLMADSKVCLITSMEEMFGYCTVEGMTLGCHVLAPYTASHPELLVNSARNLYVSLEDAITKILGALDDPWQMPPSAERYDESINKMIDIIEKEEGENVFNQH